MFIWQVPHFLAIATFRRDDYARAGLKVLPVERGDRVTRVHIVAYLVALARRVVRRWRRRAWAARSTSAAAALLGAAFFGLGMWGLRPSAGVRWARGLFAVLDRLPGPPLRRPHGEPLITVAGAQSRPSQPPLSDDDDGLRPRWLWITFTVVALAVPVLALLVERLR